MNEYDSIIIGSGHNALVCAAYLAKAGQRVVVLEAADHPGGLAADREFHPGFRAPIAHTACHFPTGIAADLDLESYGYAAGKDLPTVGLDADGRHVILSGDELTGLSDADGDAYREFRTTMSRFADALGPFWLRTMPRIGGRKFSDLTTFAQLGLNLKKLGKDDMREFLRVASLPARDLVDEYFENDILKATLSWDGLIGSKMAPRSPNSAILMMLYRMSGASRGQHAVPRGGVAGLTNALVDAATAAGVDIRCGNAVERVLIDAGTPGLAATGVRLANGEELAADRVVSGADAKNTFLKLVGVEYLDIGFTNRIRRLRCDGYVAKLHLALDELPEISGLPHAKGRMIIAPDLDALEFSYDAAKYGELPDQPVMEFVVPSLHETAMAPDGKHVLSAHVMYVPYSLKGGWTDSARAAGYECAIDLLNGYVPGIRDLVIGHEFLTPADLEREFRVTGGHWHHAEFAMDQMLMMRPTYEAAQYGTPIPGLYLCSASSHPGGDLTGAAGHNAAKEILR